MVTLVLVRHAKSDWGDPSLPDHDRPLNDRGRRNAPEMAERFAASGTEIERVISSTAVRAHSTAAELAIALGLELELDAELYDSSASTMIEKAANSGVRSVMLVAHNPGITLLADRLSDGSISHMPTCAVATFTWDADDWKTVDWRMPMRWRLDTPR